MPHPDARPGELTDLTVHSRALRRDVPVTVYLPARFRRTGSYPLLLVHDGPDFLQYAAAKTVLDNLIHRLDVAETVVAFLQPQDRLTEHANSTAHARLLSRHPLPRAASTRPPPPRRRGGGRARRAPPGPSARCLMGSSFGAVASLSAAVRS